MTMGPIGLEQFCSEDPSRENLHAPVICGAYAYASNGHLAVRVPAEGYDCKRDDAWKPGPQIDRCIRDAEGQAAIPMPDLPEVAYKTCPECGGKKKCWLSSETTGGDYEVDCPLCGQTGQVVSRDVFKIGNVSFDVEYLRMFEWFSNVTIAVGGPSDAALIRFDGGVGLLMPTKV